MSSRHASGCGSFCRRIRDVEIAGEAEDGVQAAERIAEVAPDVVFLDIQMPGASGLDVAASLGQPRPFVIFCTAFDQYAVDAFELSATDYLLKPVNRARLAAALDRVRQKPSVRDQERGLDVSARREGLTPTRFLARRRLPLSRGATRRRRRLHVRRGRHPPADGHRATFDAAHTGSAGPAAGRGTLLPDLANRDRASRWCARSASRFRMAPAKCCSPTARPCRSPGGDGRS